MSVEDVLQQVDSYRQPARRSDRRRAAAPGRRLSPHGAAPRYAAGPCCSKPAGRSTSAGCRAPSSRWWTSSARERRVRQSRVGQHRQAGIARSGEVRHPGSQGLRVRARHRDAARPGSALRARCCSRLFTVCSNPQDLSEWILEDRLPVRLQLQIHKHIWGADVRGV